MVNTAFFFVTFPGQVLGAVDEDKWIKHSLLTDLTPPMGSDQNCRFGDGLWKIRISTAGDCFHLDEKSELSCSLDI